MKTTQSNTRVNYQNLKRDSKSYRTFVSAVVFECFKKLKAITALFPISPHCINNKFCHVSGLGDLARTLCDQESQDNRPNVVDEVRLMGVLLQSGSFR